MIVTLQFIKQREYKTRIADIHIVVKMVQYKKKANKQNNSKIILGGR